MSGANRSVDHSPSHRTPQRPPRPEEPDSARPPCGHVPVIRGHVPAICRSFGRSLWFIFAFCRSFGRALATCRSCAGHLAEDFRWNFEKRGHLTGT